ncbi:PLP-dependent transferase [Mycobacteroides abscessus]|uniref:PLP-dependent transferase n=1 Tax=Mycobacteroides abscessus TaxID=36809 RepID=UPI0004AD0DF3
MFEERLRLIEGAEAAFATATGMSAVFTALGALLGAGDRLVAARSLFGFLFSWCATRSCPVGVWRPWFVDGEDISQWEEALSVPRRPSSLKPLPIHAIARGHRGGVHSGACLGWQRWCWTTSSRHRCCTGHPAGSRCGGLLGHQAQSTGRGRVLGGRILGETEYIEGPVKTLMRHTGPALSPSMPGRL